MSCKFSQHDSNMNALQHSMAPPPNAHAPQPGMNYIRSGSQGGGHKDHRISSPHHLQQRQPQHLQQQQYYNQHVPQPQQRYTQQPQQQQQSSHMMRFTSSGGYGAPSHGQQQQQVHHHQQQRQQQQQPSYHHQQQQQHSQNHPSAQQQQPSQNHMVSNAMSYRDNTCRSQSPRPQPQVVRLPPINFEDETPSPDNGRYDNDRIQNDLLDEICSDIGIKDAIDLDMFDFDANAEHYVIQPTRLPDDLDSLDQTIPFSAMTKQEDLLVPDGAIEGLSNAPQYPQQSSHVKVSSTSAVPRSMTEESIASPTISSSSNSHKANVGSSRPSSVSSADSPAAVHSTTSSTGSSDKHEADARPDVDQCTSDDQKALMCPGFLQRLATASPHEGDVSSPSPRPADLKTEHPANKLPASPYNMANTCQTSVASSPYKTGDKPSMSRSISRPQRSLSSPFDPGYFSIGSPTVCTANNQYEGSTNLSAAGPNCADDTNSKVMRFLNQVSGTESGPGVVPDGISTSGTCSALTSKSNSPTGAPAKRPRIISNGSDLLEEMRERYMFTKGANIYAKSPNSAMPPPVQRSRMYPSNQPSAATSPGLPQQQHQQLSSCSMNSGEQQTFNFGHTATGFGGMSHNGSYSQQQQASQDMPPPPGLFPASCVGSMPRPASMQPPNPVAMQQPSSPACMGGGGPSGMYGSCPDLSPPRGQVYPQQQQQQQQHQGYNSSQQQLPQPPCYASQGANSSQMLSTSSSSVPGSFSAPNTPSKHPQQPRPYNHTMAGSQMRQNLMRMYPTTPQHPQQQQPQGGVGVMDNQCLSGGVDISTDYHGQSHHMDPALHSPHLNGPMQTPVDMLPGNSTPSMQAGDPHLANLPSSSSSTSLSHGFMQHLINDRSSAFRSHPLFPLLRDLIIADMNFHSPSFPFALIANLPADFDRLLQNYLARNPPLPNQQNNDAVQGVIMDALKYAHSALIEKIQCRKVKEGYDGSDKPLCAIEDFCERFDRAVKNTMKPDRDVGGGMPPPPPNVTAMQPQHQHHGQAYPQYQRQPPSSVAQQPRHQYQQQQQQQQQQQPMMTPPSPYSHLDPFTFPGERRSQSLPPSPARKPLPHPFLQAGGGMAGGHMMAGSDFNIHMSAGKRSHDQTHSTGSGGKNKVLPKEAVQLMLDWLRQHQDNPYPNDDEKEMLINKTKLTINQINYWFTNARRRILPKWALQRYMEQQEKQKEAEKKKSQEADSPPPLVGSTKAS